ncbi:hypothetical protein EGW08_000027 [Elysia chlorotica]|uniref:Cytoplasmic tRNA 2-thiolation protein 2 n=1 Tax=Elysia chlorotica TaxID=188477 RepID=A0A433UEH5_ELYCH|nr:hypothetical protein EGW08_000027 [Elysia chlorotica]
MCNVEDRDCIGSENSHVSRSGQRPTGSGCVKCGEPGVLVTRIHDSFCKNCFQVYVVHKFRSAIGKSKLIRDGETVLVAFSGGGNSSALLHLIQDGLSLRAHKRLRFTPTLIHIDESCIFGMRTDETRQKREKIRQIMIKSGFPSYWTQLEENQADYNTLRLSNLGQEPETNFLPDPPLEESGKVQDLIKSFKSSTAQEDFIHNLRNQLLVAAAQQLGFSKILTAESSTRLAVRILSDIAQGRGSQVSLDTVILDLNAKELAMYNSLFGVDSVFIPTLTTKTSMASSIERLTETFVTGLQADYPSTVSNIVRTSGKLGGPDVKRTDKCSFCQSPLDTDVGKTSALGAVLFSQQLSRPTVVDHKDNMPSVEDTPTSSGCDHSAAVLLTNLKEALCYGCRISLHEFNGEATTLPTFITKRTMSSIRERQRDQLNGFLLEDDSEANGVR